MPKQYRRLGQVGPFFAYFPLESVAIGPSWSGRFLKRFLSAPDERHPGSHHGHDLHVGARAGQKILAVCTLDLMAWVLLKPWFLALREAGYQVHIACSAGEYFDLLQAEGFRMHAVSMKRSFNPLVHVLPLIALYRIVRAGNFQAVNTHSPVAALLGRCAAWLAGSPAIVYTVHGFYFHDNMPRLRRRLFVALEWLLGRTTDFFMFVSEEDRQTALRTGIASSPAKTATIFNGVDLSRYSSKASRTAASAGIRERLRISGDKVIVGIVGRIVREKGYGEFLEMAKEVARSRSDVVFVVVGDSLPSDRDQFGSVLKRKVRQAGMENIFLFTGFTRDVPAYLAIMDIFVLPSYREGFPRSILEAMATELPVVTTDIRGCREAVLHGTTGLIVPPANAGALAKAVLYLLEHPDEAKQMGERGRCRVVELFDEKLVSARFVQIFNRLIGEPAGLEGVKTCAAR